MFVRNSAYGFETRLSLEQIYETLSASLPWKWHRRENHAYGDYLWASTDFARSALRIIEEDGRYVIDVEFHSDRPGAEGECERLHQRVRDELLPAIGATAVHIAPHHGR